jgi:A/G-specific adenine glycosylase
LRILDVKISNILAAWYQDHKRDLPWRLTRDPYAIWVSEIILQQTRVLQGVEYYRSFMEQFPDLRSLAEARLEKVLRIWQGLGYYSRARNMHAAAHQIVMDHGGVFPSTYQEMLTLKGIGPYTAAAISSIAFNEPQAVVDGNVHRVLARLFGIYEPYSTAGSKCKICQQAEVLLDRSEPGIHNQAIMEFGALVCTPANPSCQFCNLQTHCTAFKNNLVNELPVRNKAIKRKQRYFHYFIVNSDNGILIRQRTGKDIWQDLYDFPLIETPRQETLKGLIKSPNWHQWFGDNEVRPDRISKIFRHILTHQVIHAKFYHLAHVPPDMLTGSPFLEVPISEISKYPVPKLIENYLPILSD